MPAGRNRPIENEPEPNGQIAPPDYSTQYGAKPRGRHRKPRKSVLSGGVTRTPVLAVGAVAAAAAAAGSLHPSEAGAQPATSSRVLLDRTQEAVSDATRSLEKAPAPDRRILAPAEVAQERSVRASRMRAREALAERARVAAALQRKEEKARKVAAAAKARAARAAELRKAFVLPVNNYRITARFGQSGSRWSRNHTGLDFACPAGTPIRAVAAGTVVETGWAGAYGWRTIIRHADGTRTWYAHQSSFVVRSGQVEAGQVIGRVGTTGNSTGPHLHFEVHEHGNTVNPWTWLRQHGRTP